MAPKKTDEKILEQLVELEQWAAANVNMLRSRGKDCILAALNQHKSGGELRFYKMLMRDKKRHEASPALAEQIAKLDSMVRATGGHGLSGGSFDRLRAWSNARLKKEIQREDYGAASRVGAVDKRQ